ncbi:MAG: dimethylarginine dimethylaminohydrolase family protein [Anaerolineae bacterium]
MELHVTSETGPLRDVLLAPVELIEPTHHPINSTQRHFYEPDPPDMQRVHDQHARFVDLLAAHDVTLHWAEHIAGAPSQYFTRDVAIVIGERLIISKLKEPLRFGERDGLASLVSSLDSEHAAAVDRGYLEGGDVLLDADTVWGGMGDRTDEAGMRWLCDYLGEAYTVIGVPLANDILHLDVVFNRVSRDLLLLYPPAIRAPELLDSLYQRFRVIEVTASEQFAMATNVVSIAPDTLVADARFTRIHGELRAHGLNVLTIEYDEVAKMGGSLRCCTCPLVRAQA